MFIQTIILSGLIIFAYLVFIVVMLIGYSKLKSKKILKTKIPLVSVIVAFRNEIKNIENLLSDLNNQEIKDIEVILVNDHSNDGSNTIVEAFCKTHKHFVLLNLPKDSHGKKPALSLASSKAKGEIFLFTDADCRLQKKWAESMCSTLINENAHLVAGPVDFEEKNSLFSKLQNLEFLSLTGSTAAGFGAGIPFMCNGANLAVVSDTYFQTFNALGKNHSSGDDVFLLHCIKKNYKVAFCQCKDAIVSTLAQDNLSSFFAQRIRWAGKAKFYKDLNSIIISFLLITVSLAMLTTLVLSVFNFHVFIVFVCLFLIKTIADNLLLFPVLKFYGKQHLMFYTPLLQFVYPIYIVITGIVGLFYKPEWKGRRIT